VRSSWYWSADLLAPPLLSATTPHLRATCGLTAGCTACAEGFMRPHELAHGAWLLRQVLLPNTVVAEKT